MTTCCLLRFLLTTLVIIGGTECQSIVVDLASASIPGVIRAQLSVEMLCHNLPKSFLKFFLLTSQERVLSRNCICSVCMQPSLADSLCGVSCGHRFCRECWQMHFHYQIQNGVSTGKSISLLRPSAGFFLLRLVKLSS